MSAPNERIRSDSGFNALTTQHAWLFRVLTVVLSLAAIGCSLRIATGQERDPFASTVRTSDPLSPADEESTFQLPPGFRIRLFAAEPDIQKPMNLAFDARGRLWVTGSNGYPFPAADGAASDTIRILEDTDGDGRADRTTTFADKLNIPIGVLPYQDGAIVFSIPNILFLRDTDGDGRSDERRILYGPFDFSRDTHGLNNAFRRGFDGWIYCCHGFNNHSIVTGADGNRVDMSSGNVYRIRPDGSRIEHYTHGQVNPFGMTIDALGDIFTSDCHTKPVTLLLRGGYYPSFGKPHNGLGFVPNVMEHLHGSTAIAGVSQYTSTEFPADYVNDLFVGNVMTSRVHRNSIQYHGSSVRLVEEPDFLISSDPWFRPVDIQCGPDGAIYVADFYNRIIGHYEVPLDHPGRDRFRGRIWRIDYTEVAADGPLTSGGAASTGRTTSQIALIDDALQRLHSGNLHRRMRATDEFTDHIGAVSIPTLKTRLGKAIRQMVATAADAPTAANPAESPADPAALAAIQMLWALHRLGDLPESLLTSSVDIGQPAVRIHALRILAETANWSDPLREVALRGLVDASSLVRRAAADAFSTHADSKHVAPLLAALRQTATDDVHLRHTLRLAIRQQAMRAGVLPAVLAEQPNPDEIRELVSIALAVPTGEAAEFLFASLPQIAHDDDLLIECMKHVASHAGAGSIEQLVSIIDIDNSYGLALQRELLESLLTGMERQSLSPSPRVRQFASRVVQSLLISSTPAAATWSVADRQSSSSQRPWGIELRNCEDGQLNVPFLSSLPGGEKSTGRLQSHEFTIPDEISFSMCGHLGFPDKPAIEDNFVQLRLSDSGEVVAKTLPPRHDVARRVVWDLTSHAGRSGRIEIVDGIDIRAFAWLAVSRFEPPVVEIPPAAFFALDQQFAAAAVIVARLRLDGFDERLRDIALSDASRPGTRGAAARALSGGIGNPLSAALIDVISSAYISDQLRRESVQSLIVESGESSAVALESAMRSTPAAMQVQLAESLGTTATGCRLLLDLIRKGHASPRLLRSATVRERVIASRLPEVETVIEELTASLPSANDEVDGLIATIRKRFAASRSTTESVRGKSVFEQRCAACHQLGSQGKLIGPQLDGIGLRGVERLIEDIVDPNRNVDVQFRSRVYVLTDGRVFSGLYRRTDGNSVIVVDNKGQEIVIPADSIDEVQETRASLMPDNWSTVISPDEMTHLLAFLAEHRQQPVAAD